MNVNLSGALSASGGGAVLAAKMSGEGAKFSELLNRLRGEDSAASPTLSSGQIGREGRLNGDCASDFAGAFRSISDRASLPRGAAANQGNPHIQPKKIDRTSRLYEKSLELESYFVKQVISSMRKTVRKASDGDFAGGMYEDMLYDEYAAAMTKSAGFGLADQIYMQLA